jgi:hypothetical protein
MGEEVASAQALALVRSDLRVLALVHREVQILHRDSGS